eukprot:g16356.t1
MLSIPFKKTDASIDLGGPLRRYLMKEFSTEEVEKYSEDLKELQGVRETATQVERPSGAGRDALLRYAAQLEALEPVFPVSETEVRVGFKWGDSFNPNKKSTQSTLLFERACVLYNLGAHESRSASEEDRSTEAGLKAACHRFQEAAGIFQHVREKVVGGLVGTVTQDLIPDGLGAASTLMLAQAQACFYEKAVKDRARTKLKPAIIAKLAAKAGEFYTQTLGFMHGPNLAPGLDKSWPAHVEFQSISFSAAACYWESVSLHDVAEETGSGYGVEIAQLQKSSGLLEQAFKLAHRNSLSTTFTTSAETLKGTITKALASRSKDNSTIYLEPVPSQATLKDVPGAGMVKAVPFVLGGCGTGHALFDGLLSKSAKAALEDYKAKEAAAIAAVDGLAKEKSALARSQLAAVGLPGTVEAHESVGGVPESVWNKVQAVKQGGGGLAELKEKVSEVEGSAERSRNTLETVERTLDQDVRLDDAFKKRYAGEYEGMSTSELARDLHRDVEHYRGLWRTARDADAKVMSRIEEPASREGLELLELTRAGLDAAMPAGKGAGADGHGGSVDTVALSSKLVELAALLADRDSKVTQLNEFVRNRNVANELAVAGRSGGGTPEAYHGAVEHALAGLQPFKADIDASVQKQEPLLEQIFAENERFQQARASDRETLDREAFLQKVHGAVMLFHEVHAQLSEGAMFYSDLLQRLAQLNQTCEDLVYTQGLNRREFEVGYTHRRERALKEGEDASIELARQMEAQALQGQPGQQPGQRPGGPSPPAPSGNYPGLGAPAAGVAGTPSAGYPYARWKPPSEQQQQQQQQQPPQAQWYGYSQPPQQQQPGGLAPPPGQQPHHPQYSPGGTQPPGVVPGAQQHPQGGYYGGPAAVQVPPGAPAVAEPAPPGRARWGPWSVGGAGAVGTQAKPLPPTPSPPGGDAAEDAKYRRLLEMGFDPARTRAALAEAKGDESAAVSKLLQG